MYKGFSANRRERGYSGRLNEEDLFGSLRLHPAAKQKMENVYRRLKGRGGYLNYAGSMELVRTCYPEGLTTNPDKEFANDLRLELVEMLGLEGEETDAVKFYSAVGTPLDVFHGVDGWLEVVDPKRGRLVVTMDVTMNPEKLEAGHKADVIIGEVPDPDDKNYLPTVEHYARVVGQALLKKIPKRKTA